MSKQNNSFLTIIAVLAIVGFVFMTGLYLGKGNSSSTVTDPTSEPEKVEIEIGSEDHATGSFGGPITIVEFSDFQCPYCSRFHDTMKQVMAAYPDKVRWVYKHFPLSSAHPYAQKAAEASECAGEQNKFWEYSDQLFTRQSEISPSLFPQISQDLNLDTNKFSECLDSGKYTDKVNNDQQEGLKLGVTGTPASFINGQFVSGSVPFAKLKEIIDNLL